LFDDYDDDLRPQGNDFDIGADEFVSPTRLENMYEKILPDNFELFQNYPNPFNPATAIKFTLPESGLVKLAVYNTLGQEEAVLINQQMEAGSYEKKFNADGLPSGTYIYRITVGDKFSSEKKMLLLK